MGFLAASLVGVPLGILAGSFGLFRTAVAPANSFLRYIPPMAFVPLFIIYFGIGEAYKYVVVFFGVFFFIVQMTMDVVEDLDARYLEMAQTSGLSRLQTLRWVIVPGTLPQIIDVLRVNLGAAWTFLVAAELIASERGLGHLVSISQRFLRVESLFAAILAFGIIGLLSDALLERLGRALTPWQRVTRVQ